MLNEDFISRGFAVALRVLRLLGCPEPREQMARYLLLPADSIDAALIQRRHLPALATRDDDFDRVENLGGTVC
jgi:predicted nucleic acid-binding protein